MPFIISATTDEDLTRLERDIRQLKIEYEQYFGGGKSRPPNEVEWRIEQILKRYGDRGAEMNYSQRFRYSNLSQTYAKYRDMFHKRLQKREEGAVEHHFGAAARAIEEERAKTRQSQAAAQPSAESGAANREHPAEPPVNEDLYRAFREALERSGESTANLTREKFQQFLLQKAKQLRRQNGGQEIEFVVSMEDGKPRLKARLRS